MKPASIHTLKSGLEERSAGELLEFCLRMARLNTDNKALLTYLVFEADDEAGYVRLICESIDVLFESLNVDNVYYAKKGLQRIVRQMHRWIRFSEMPATEVEIRMHFLRCMQQLKASYHEHRVIGNLRNRQATQIRKVLGKLHEDLQFDYRRELEEIMGEDVFRTPE